MPAYPPQGISSRSWLCVAAVLALACVSAFGNITRQSIRQADESLYAVTAIEMEARGSYIVRYFDGAPDMWNTKPPLMEWALIASMKLVGYNELGVRLPSALCVLLTVLVLLRFAHRHLGRVEVGILAALALLSTRGYISYHVTRTGDLDAALTLFMTIAALYFYKLTVEPAHRALYLYLTAAALILACLTKGISGLMFVPGFALFALYSRQLRTLLTAPHFYGAVVLFVLCVGGYYLLRESVNSGYLHAVWDNELGGRYMQALEGHGHEFSWYAKKILQRDFVPWCLVLPAAALVVCNRDAFNARRFTLFTLICTASFLLIISLARTKLDWYAAPIYPVTCLVVGAGLLYFLEAITRTVEAGAVRVALTALLILAVFALPLYTTTATALTEINDDGGPNYGRFVNELPVRAPRVASFKMYYPGWSPHLQFYALTWSRQPGRSAAVVKDLLQLRAGDNVMVCEPPSRDAIAGRFAVTRLGTFEECEMLRLESESSP
jgi:4-amino-4-deoxy-L-arabinose transferase-like glycosyltransferase